MLISKKKKFTPLFTEEKSSSVRLDMPENDSHNLKEVMTSSNKME
jgi:hypothetical protein